ncbi:MAG: hypothetical protein UR39_C0016G0008 [Candidatus Woesebacteria bacterium GW2011_GWA1_33_30]|uniref:Phage-Barnase-EndoU-ColicinE5/D-RelE like nuclease 3 domain-containing protein n=1 Tax=Candidatus Woesebacteria bacterium GW2011_GWA2_33_28 TaxID=1618561 RepID=A0A0F9ZUT4_9BACT|nr:MAG: hypothetical protein UR39_C0016G0008 [Candidatus Woesebacteria bacterium GW2011_GWA1_33_30]KKP48098.1 MAG: hypothetical protein UR38_C0002G0201 [Candidatus Woesebacteria bacterium GW2011_GWA2_33_28]KKP50184.1 MAG: hypothetical protein UR40_C0002G0201 [Microgenomates group bacterium GW2011_GWC1_33_32]KKP51954.1 MAG: hypothetical protein UR44_C0006G0200 [Candidatus Woesebacteria bacterium GW2011_GWB1_33_38]KKP58259.1 MAG: hypothetical protein UR48_C0006G0008 [Microgenomates group bacteriu
MHLLKGAAKDFFKKNKYVYSPTFRKEKIFLNSKGINHLFYKGSRSGRNLKEVQTRIKLLPRAITLLKLMPIAQEEDFYIQDKVKYKFWAFEGVVKGKKIKVIVRQIGNGNKHFWSVIPSWRKNRFGIVNSRKKLSKT